MKLRYINLWRSHESTVLNELYSDAFNYMSRYISNYLSKAVRTLKIEMDEPIKMLSVDIVNGQEQIRMLAEDVLDIKVRIDESELVSFFQTKDLRTRSEICLSLIERGYQIASREHNIPIEALMSLHSQFRSGGYKNEWLFKELHIKERRMKIALTCSFTSYDFSLNLECTDKDTGQLLAIGPVIRTAPDEVCYDHLFKTVTVNKHDIILNYFLGNPGTIISIDSLREGMIKVSYPEESVGRSVRDGSIIIEGLHDLERKVVGYKTIMSSGDISEEKGVWATYAQWKE